MAKYHCVSILLVISLFLLIKRTESLAGRCYANGRIYRHGETKVTRGRNNRLYRCTCIVSPTGRAERNCTQSREDAHVVIADGDKISKIALGGGFGFSLDYIKHLQGIAVSVDVDLSSDLIFWTDVSDKGRGIYKARYSDGRSIYRIVSDEIYEPNGISVDWLSKNIYWTDAQLGAIFVARNDGKMKTQLISGLPEPRCIVVLPTEGIMFWNDQTAGTIESAKMDGSDRRVVISELVWPNEIAVNLLERRLYWIDAYKRSIESCNFDGTDYSNIFDYSYTRYNTPGFGLSLFQDHLYFGLWNESSDRSSMFSITKIGQRFKSIVTNLGPKPMGMKIINPQRQRHDRNTNRCWSPGSGVCSHLCLPMSYNLHRCACPSNTGLVLSRDGRNCIIPDNFILYTSIDEGTVMMVSTENGADKVPSLLAQSHQPSAVAFDPVDRIVYWSDVAMNAIYRKKLGDLNVTMFIQDGIGTIDGLSVDYTNRHLYFTNMGWHGSGVPFHQVEMVSLDDAGERKILNSTLLGKPRDILIDHENGLLYISDWGQEPKIIKSDLDGQGQVKLPISVENPNGIALNGYELYIVDSHVRSALVNTNGTVVYGRAPTLVQYNTEFDNYREIDGINMEVPFGLTNAPDNKLYMTDWGLGGIYEVFPDLGTKRGLIIGVQKPTGIAYASLRYRKYDNECTRGSRQCSDICVSIASIDLVCMCPDRSATALSGTYNCVDPDSFMLVADGTQIVMKSFDPDDYQQYVIVRTFDLLSNIVAVTYDPETNFVYWADNGRQRIQRKNLRDKKSGPGNYETIFTNIGRIEGLAVDSDHRLLYWTDAEAGTIEMLSLTTNMQHTTLRTRLSHPRAIVLYPEAGLMYWTEEGDLPMVFSATMSGKDPRRLVGSDQLKWPNGLYLEKESDRLWIADGGRLEIMAVFATGEPAMLDQRDVSRVAGHVFGLWMDPTTSQGSSMIYTDWVNRTVIKGTEVFMDNLVRPSQIFLKKPYQRAEITDMCTIGIQRCSHICIPSVGSFVCLCPDHLLLAYDQRTCLTEREMHLLTSTTEATTTTTTARVTTTTAKWADIITSTTSAPVTTTEETTQTLSATTPLVSTTADTTTTSQTSTTTQATTTEVQTEVSTIPGRPYFSKCDETNIYEKTLPVDDAVVNVTSSLLDLEAFDGKGKPLKITILDVFNDTLHYMLVPVQNLTIPFRATDEFGITISCNIQLAVVDRTPPRVLYCPDDMELETYSQSGEAFVSWKPPKFVDNSGVAPEVISSYEPGMFRVALYNVTYRANDDAGNSAYCIFQLAILQKESLCHKPHAPLNSQLTCSVVNGLQKCLITCDKYYHLSLADPYITCQKNVDGDLSAWVPFLSSGICTRPSVANIEQEVHLHYPSPCRPDFKYYSDTRNSFSKSLRSYADCQYMEHKLGLCNTKKGGKLHVDCVDFQKLNVTVTVDLDNLIGIRDTKQVKDIVARSANTIAEKATEGKIVVQGYAEKKEYTVDIARLAISQASVVCDIGFVSAEDEGCVQCPKGTFSKGNKCEYCPYHHYQDEMGRTHCIECPLEKGTKVHGATDKSYCKVMKRVADDTSVPIGLIVAGVIGSMIVIAAVVFIVVFVRRRRKNNKLKKEQERIRREQEERRRRRSTRKRNRSNTAGRSTQRKGENPRTKSQNSNNIPMDDLQKRNTTNQSATKNLSLSEAKAKQVEIKSEENKSEASKSKNLKQKISAAEPGKSVEEENNLSGTENPASADAASDTTSVVSPNPPLKSALKKRKNPLPPEEYLEEDTSTVISASTITSAQLRRANIKPRSTTLDKDSNNHCAMTPGAAARRSMSMRKTATSPSSLRNDGPASLGLRRNISFDHRDPGTNRMFPPRFNMAAMPQQQPPMPRMPQQVPGMRIPMGPSYPMVGPRPTGPQIYGTFRPRQMPPPGAKVFIPNRPPRHHMMAGTMPGRQQGSPFKSGYWNEGPNGPEWDQIRNRPEILHPLKMMTLPRGSPSSRFRMPVAGMASMRPYPPMAQPPPPYFA